MDCDTLLEVGSVEYMSRFRRQIERDRIPVSGAFDLTYRCNLRCVHCYAGHLTGESAGRAGELGAQAVLRLISDAAAEGCLQLLLSGGEPLLRPDFTEIYLGARSLGLMVTVFTNATLVADEHLAAFRDSPPYRVEVSLYGATSTTFDVVTGVPGSFERARRGIDRLLAAGVRVGLKTMILRDNAHEVAAMEALAASIGVAFRVDSLVTPRLDGEASPLAQRVGVDTAVAVESSNRERWRELAAYADRQNVAALPAGGRIYRCGAGLTHFHLDPQGVLYPCLMSRTPAFDAAGEGFAPAWRSVAAAIDGVVAQGDHRCDGCAHAAVCGYCPGLFELETGTPQKPPEFVCRLGKRRTEALPRVSREGDHVFVN
jgi:radical SAM protein with 4Fe4S-binding SPASM domain